MKAFIVATVLICFTGLATAQDQSSPDVASPRFNAGDSWKFKYTQDPPDQGWYQESVESVGDGEAWLRIDDSRGRRFSWSYDVAAQKYLRFFAYSSKSATGRGRLLKDSSGDDSWLRFPFRVGSSWSVVRHFKSPEGDPISQRLTAKVSGQETIETPAGKFATYKIELAGHWANEATLGTGGTGRHTETYWYAPSVKRFVRREIKSYGSSLVKMWSTVIYARTDELVEADLQPDK